MKRRTIVLFVIVSACFINIAGQDRTARLSSWADRYPTIRKGKVTKSFFQVPEIRQPLVKLLSKENFALLTREYKVETPIKRIGDFLAVKVCRAHMCSEEQAGFAINLRDGAIYVRMFSSDLGRWLSSRGDVTDLPAAVREFIEDFSAT